MPHLCPDPNLTIIYNHCNRIACSSSSGTGQTVGNVSGSGAVTIYTTTTNEGVAGGGTGGGNGGNNNNNGITGGGPLQEIIVNPTSMVGWRLSANGSLIPPHDLLTGNLPNAATQKRGSERLFQYLEAEGSDPEDYARYLPHVVCFSHLFASFVFLSLVFFVCNSMFFLGCLSFLLHFLCFLCNFVLLIIFCIYLL